MQNSYLPKEVIITDIEEKHPEVRLFKLRFTEPGEQQNFEFNPGQFIMVSICGSGEMPITLCSSPMEKNTFEILVRRLGRVSGALFHLKSHDKLFVRGPYGRGFEMEKLKRKNLALIAGGLGIAPLRSIIHYLSWNKKDFGDIRIFIGAREPNLLILRDEFPVWQKFAAVYSVVEKTDASWQGARGMITKILHPETIPSKNCVAICVGPPLMYKFVAEKLKELGFIDKNILMSLERHMKCGIGLCQRCTCNGHYICKEGPVFSLEEIERDLPEAIS